MLPATQPRWAYKVRSTVIGPAGYKAVKPLQYWITIVYLFYYTTSGGSPFGQQRPNFMLYLLVYIYLNYYLSLVEGLPLVDRGLISCYFLVVFKLHTSLYGYFFRLLCYVILNSVL